MDYQVLENNELRVEILNKGAELKSIRSKKDGTEYLWQANDEFWGRHAPILFPIVGKLKDDRYSLDGQTYAMSQHGFARDRVFSITEKQSNSIALTLADDEASFYIYPFKFELTIEYKLIGNRLMVSYLIKNLDAKNPMYFAIGAHPGFNLPLDDRTSFDDYFLEFSPKRTRKFIPVTEEVLLKYDEKKDVTDSIYPLTRELFADGVLIWETMEPTRIELKSNKTRKSVVLEYSKMPYLGIWSTYPQEAGFICIEPWCGIADTYDSNGKYDEKLGVNTLPPETNFQSSYQMTFV